MTELRGLIEAALVTHQRRSDQNDCICGWHRLGYSFPGHQADMILLTVEREQEVVVGRVEDWQQRCPTCNGMGKVGPGLTCPRCNGVGWVERPEVRRNGRTLDEAWDLWFAEHPDVRASWAHQNGRWPEGYDGVGEDAHERQES